MNKTKIVNSLITLIVPVVTVITASVAWFMAKNLEKDNGANGSLGLSTYFYQGEELKMIHMKLFILNIYIIFLDFKTLVF